MDLNTMKKTAVLDLKTTDPAWNLAAEQVVFDCMPRDRNYLMLWQNDNAIIIGKYQNTAAEINTEYVHAHGIRVVRRLSGGGAVFHDLGNLNFTFITDADRTGGVDLKPFCEPVVRALARFGVRAEIDGRNDITVDGKKFSGNAQYRREGRVMHHGTILFDSRLETVQEALRVDAEKIRSKGISSVRSRVTNIRPYLPEGTSLEDFKRALLEEIAQGGKTEFLSFTAQQEEAILRLKKERYDTRAWNYASSPSCTLLKQKRIEGCGKLELYVTVEKDRIAELEIRGDFFAAEDPSVLARCLLGCRPEKEECEKALSKAGVRPEEIIVGLSQKDFLDLLC